MNCAGSERTMNLMRVNWKPNSNWKQVENFTIAPVDRGHFSPVGFLDSGSIVGNYLSRETGQTTFAILDLSGEIEPSTRELSMAESVRNNFVCGSIGFGDRAFLYHPTKGVVMLPADQFGASCAQSVNRSGVVVGSVTDELGEYGATWRNGQLEVTKSVRFWTHILENGSQVGICQEGTTLLSRSADGEFEEIASADNGFLGILKSEWVLSKRNEHGTSISIAGRAALPSCRVIHIDSTEESLMFQLIGDEGKSQWIELRGDQMFQLIVPPLPNEFQLRSISCYGPENSLIGIADDGKHSYVCVFEPERIELNRAVISS